MNFIHKHFTPYRDSAYQLSTVYCLPPMSNERLCYSSKVKKHISLNI